jgi:hypothetical protein
MLIKISLISLWIIFTIYAFFFSPASDPNTLDLILNLSTGKWQDINPLLISLFNLMGILPMVYTCFLLIDGRGQKIPAWLFATASFGLGAFALIPYLIFRQPNPNWTGEKNNWLKIADSRWTGIVLLVMFLVILGRGVFTGDWNDFIQQWHSSKFINVMGLDFCCLNVLFLALLPDDLNRRDIQNKSFYWSIASIPLIGSLLYLCLRPQLNRTIEKGAI